jgi:hypothetical protein
MEEENFAFNLDSFKDVLNELFSSNERLLSKMFSTNGNRVDCFLKELFETDETMVTFG